MFNNKRRPRKGPLPFSYVFIISIAIFTLLTAQGLWLVNIGIKPTIMDMAVVRTEQIATEAINDAISKKIVESGLNNIIIKQDDGGVSYDMQIYNRAQSEAIYRVQNYLKKAEQGKLEQWLNAEEVQVETGEESQIAEGEIATIPLGQATNIALFANLGPKIPIRLVPMGSVKSTPVFTVDKVGINNALATLKLEIQVDVQVVIPFETDETTIVTEVLLDGEYIPGEVPNFYAPGNSSIQPAIPIEDIDKNNNLDQTDAEAPQ